jgi:hypothetical protein
LEFVGFGVKGHLVFSDFFVDGFVEFAVVHKDIFHFLDLFDDKGVFFDERLHGDTSTDKLLINGYEIVEIFVVNEFLELLDLIL